MTHSEMYDAAHLEKCAANYIPLSPLSFLSRAAKVHPQRTAVIYNDKKTSWAEFFVRTQKMADALKQSGVGYGDTVTVVLHNTPELMEAHYGIPMAGAVLNTLNTRLDAGTISYCINQAESKVLITDTEFSPTMKEVLKQLDHELILIEVVDDYAKLPAGTGERLGGQDYEEFINSGKTGRWDMPQDEWQAIALNYTSGTSGKPKGVIYHHRGAYLMSMGSTVAWGMPQFCTHLQTVPMFHCNGWGYPWTIALLSGTLVCIRNFSPALTFKLIAEHKIEFFGGAPVVLNMLANASKDEITTFDHQVQVMTAGSPPPAKTLELMTNMGFEVTHVYGLTETYGHTVFCKTKDQWRDLPIEQQAELKARQGIAYPMMEEVSVLNPDDMSALPFDSESMGEIMLRGNTIMKGYLKNPQATAQAFANGWYHSEDLGVTYDDAHIQLKDRAKDIIISGGENVSSVEVENVISKHPAVSLVSIVAMPDDKWQEVPCAFVELKEAAETTEEEIIKFCRGQLAGFKTPKKVVFGELPKTATGKIQKFVLRETAKSL